MHVKGAKMKRHVQDQVSQTPAAKARSLLAADKALLKLLQLLSQPEAPETFGVWARQAIARYSTCWESMAADEAAGMLPEGESLLVQHVRHECQCGSAAHQEKAIAAAQMTPRWKVCDLICGQGCCAATPTTLPF